MRRVALVIVIFSLLAAGFGMMDALALPSEPRTLVATAGAGQVGLTWQAPSFVDSGYPVTNYRVHRGTTSGTATFLANAGTSLSYTDTAVMAGQTYYYQVSAENFFGESPRSSEDSATPTAPTALTAPQNLVATAGAGQVGLTWQVPLSDGGSPITNYRVHRGTASGTATFLANAGTSLSYTDTAVMAGQTYYYQVSAENTVGEGPRSNEGSATLTATAPIISIVEPMADTTVGPVVFLRVQIAGFTLDPESIGQASVPGRGHYHVTVDGTTIDFMVTGLIYAVKDLAEGEHTIKVSLHNNDHSALTPEVSDVVTVTVAAPTPPPAGIDAALFAGTTIGLIVLLIVVAVALILWGRRGRQAP